ncbi:MAG: hypothetical protein WAO55_07335 [Candidatus Manganitrophaceae bacterium]
MEVLAFHKRYWIAATIASFLAAFPGTLRAIHFVINSSERIQREHGPAELGMPLPQFLRKVKSKEAGVEIGQFTEERRFLAEPFLFAANGSNGLGAASATSVVADFYLEKLFRIEINFTPVGKDSNGVKELIEQLTKRYGPPQVTTLPGADLRFWDDGKTRLILESDLSEGTIAYSTTYIDVDLFHQASRERVQKETEGKSSYGRPTLPLP